MALNIENPRLFLDIGAYDFGKNPPGFSCKKAYDVFGTKIQQNEDRVFQPLCLLLHQHEPFNCFRVFSICLVKIEESLLQTYDFIVNNSLVSVVDDMFFFEGHSDLTSQNHMLDDNARYRREPFGLEYLFTSDIMVPRSVQDTGVLTYVVKKT